MSLLLDALQRASEEKEKLAEALASEKKHKNHTTQPDHSPLPTIVEDLEIAPTSTPPAITHSELPPTGNQPDHDSLPDFEFQATPSSFDSAEAKEISPYQKDTIDSHPEQPVPIPVEELALELAPALEATTAAAPRQDHAVPPAGKTHPAEPVHRPAPPDKTASMTTTAHRGARFEPTHDDAGSSSPAGRAHPSPTISAQVAQDILGATAKLPKTKQRRLIVLFAIGGLLLAVALAGIFLVPGLLNEAPAPESVFDPYTQNGAAVAVAPETEQAAPAVSEKTATAESDAPPAPAKTDSGENTPLPISARSLASDMPPGDIMPNALSGVTRNLITNNAGSKPSQQKQSGNASKPVFVVAPAAGDSPLDLAYAALKEGRYDEAAKNYQLALTRNSGEVDALLGLAYIARRQGHGGEARSYYSEVLRQFPWHPAATAGLLSIASEGDIQAATSRAGEMAQRNPDSAIALSTLGNLLAKQGRIAEAQQAYFRAFVLEPSSAQHAYNLAVALDRLHKYPQALQYYKRAIALSENVATGTPLAFSRDAALQRMQQLDGAAGTTAPASAGNAQ